MSDTFIPLVSANSATREASFFSLHLKTSPPAAGRTGVPAGALLPGTGACAKPVVTLQRNGEVVSSIRIQCGCGEVIELNCVY